MSRGVLLIIISIAVCCVITAGVIVFFSIYEKELNTVYEQSVAQSDQVESIATLIKNEGGRVDYSPDGKQIAFDRLGDDGYYDTWVMDADGTDQRCVTCDISSITDIHNGQPEWYPDGKHILVQAVYESSGVLDNSLVGKWYTNPGAGFHNTLWVVSVEGGEAYKLLDYKPLGLLHARFSNDGRSIIWSEMISTNNLPLGEWEIKQASVSIDKDQLKLSDIRSLTPGNMQWYETHDIHPVDGSILFTGMTFDENTDIYRYYPETKKLQRLTEKDSGVWHEHAHFSPDGTKVIWMSSMDIPSNGKITVENLGKGKTDYWVMDSDGSNQKRMTYFNDPDAPEYIFKQVIVADLDIHPSGKKFVAYIQNNPSGKRSGSVMVIELSEKLD